MGAMNFSASSTEKGVALKVPAIVRRCNTDGARGIRDRLRRLRD